MKKKSNKQIEDTLNRIKFVTRHIKNVQDNCLLLGEKLILNGEIDLGRNLIANGFQHDVSKFFGIEWENMLVVNIGVEKETKLKLKLAVNHHTRTNNHHPEKWGTINLMPDVFLAEFCCDVKARSEEFGTDIREWIDTQATKKFNFTKESEVYKKVMKYIDMLCPPPFENLNK